MSRADEKLHDEIDLLEKHIEQANESVKRVVLEHIEDAVDQTSTLPEALAWLAAKVEDELQGLTTEVVQGLGAARRKL